MALHHASNVVRLGLSAVALLALSCPALGQSGPPAEWVRQAVGVAADDVGISLASDGVRDRSQATFLQAASPVEVWVGGGEIGSGWGVWVPIFTTGMERRHLTGGIYFRTIWTPGLVPLVISTEHGASRAVYTPWSCETGCQGWMRVQLNPGDYGPCDGDGPAIFAWVFAQAAAVDFDQAESVRWYDCDLIAGTGDPAARMHDASIVIRANPPEFGAVSCELYEPMDWGLVFGGQFFRVTLRVGNGYQWPVNVRYGATGFADRSVTIQPGEWRYLVLFRSVPHALRGRWVTWKARAAWDGGTWQSEPVRFKIR